MRCWIAAQWRILSIVFLGRTRDLADLRGPWAELPQYRGFETARVAADIGQWQRTSIVAPNVIEINPPVIDELCPVE